MTVHPIPLPKEYEKRYVVAWTVAILPLAGVLLAFAWMMRPEASAAFVLVIAAFVATNALILWRSAARSRTVLEACGNMPRKRGGVDLAAPAATLFVGGINAILKADWRWILIAAWVGAVMGCGLALRWLILDRWLQSQIAERGT